jgi:hypothetical protein
MPAFDQSDKSTWTDDDWHGEFQADCVDFLAAVQRSVSKLGRQWTEGEEPPDATEAETRLYEVLSILGQSSALRDVLDGVAKVNGDVARWWHGNRKTQDYTCFYESKGRAYYSAFMEEKPYLGPGLAIPRVPVSAGADWPQWVNTEPYLRESFVAIGAIAERIPLPFGDGGQECADGTLPPGFVWLCDAAAGFGVAEDEVHQLLANRLGKGSRMENKREALRKWFKAKPHSTLARRVGRKIMVAETWFKRECWDKRLSYGTKRNETEPNGTKRKGSAK